MITTINTVGLFVIIIITAILGYFAGLRRGITGSQHLYDDGWIAAEEYFKRFPELVEGVEEDDEDRYDKARELLKQLDELFEDDEEEDNVIDCGEY